MPKTHTSLIHRILGKTELILPHVVMLETIYPHLEPPWTEKRWEVENLGESREIVKSKIQQQTEDERGKKSLCDVHQQIAYPGNGGGGAAVATGYLEISHAYGPVEGVSNYKMEAMAIMIAMVKFRQVADAHPNKYNSLAIFSDSQAALNLLAQPLDMKTLQYLARFLLRT